MKCNQPRQGFELVSPCPYPATITITPRAPLFDNNVFVYHHLFVHLYDIKYLLTCTCIGFSPWSGCTSFLPGKFLIEEDTLRFDWGKSPKSYPEKRPVYRRFSTDTLTEWPEATDCRNRHLLDFHQSPFSRVAALMPLGARPTRLGWPYQEPKFPTA